MNSSAPKNKRLLVLTSATGAGHDTHAQATADWCARLYGDKVEVTIAHALEDSHVFYRGAVNFYNFIQQRMPWFHHIYYNIIELLETLNPGTVSLGRQYYIDLLQRTRPDAILSVMDCLNRGYFELARGTMGRHVKCATYCTEFAGGYGFSRNWVNPRADYFFARTEEARLEAIRHRMEPTRALVAGHWEPPSFHLTALTAELKSAYLRDTLELDPGRFTLLLSTGGAAAQNHEHILQALFPLGDRLQVIALCGRDDAARRRLEKWASKVAPFPVRVLGFSSEMPALLQVSSAVVARGGATTAGESLLCQCPMIFNFLGGSMPQELPTWRYFEERGIGFRLAALSDIHQLVRGWLERPESLVQIRSRLAECRNETTPSAALHALLGEVDLPG